MILITGGSGFIGTHFHRFLPLKQLINLDLNEPAFESKSQFIKGDIRKEDDVRKAIEGNNIKTIISLAAKHHDFGIGHDEYFDTNEDGTAVICKVASENNVKEIVFYSSVAVYGLRSEVSSENMEPLPDSPYGASKLAGEKVLRRWAAEDPDRKLLIIRPTIVFGPGNMANMKNLIRQIDSGFYFHLGKGDNIKSIAYVENVISATLFLLERLKPGVSIYNYADEPQLTTREIGNHIADFLHKKIRVTIPKQIGVMLGIPFDVAIKLTGKNLPISSARIEKLGTQTYHSARKLFDEGFTAKHSTIDGIGKMVEWYKQESNFSPHPRDK
jgi:GlcNAc-P-P-Und epimerase